MNKNEVQSLHPLELKVLLFFKQNDRFSSSIIVSEMGMVLGQANQSISWLEQKNLIAEQSRTQEVVFERTAFGDDWKNNGTPTERLLTYIAEHKNSVTLAEASGALGIEQKDIGSAFGLLSKQGFVRLDENKRINIIADTGTGIGKEKSSLPQEIEILQQLLSLDGAIVEQKLSEYDKRIINQYAKKRGAEGTPFKRIERETVLYSITDLGAAYAKEAKKLNLTGEETNLLIPEMLKDGSWKEKTFRKYNIALPPNRVSVGRRNPYAEFLQQVKDRLVGLGFEEFDGSLVQTEFWNSDALFMPQFHPARDTHDVYYVKNPPHAKEIEEPWLSNIAAAHEDGGDTGSKGWNYSFDKNFAKRLILRSQGTVLSAQTLTKAKNPGKYFGILRVFRPDQVDATHLSDFYQTEGIIIGDDVNIQTLLGLLKVFAEELAHAEEVKYVPGYFPFTEPSVEVHIKHPKIGWMELGGSGIFRPEVTKPLGIDVPVAAWGIGIDRMATMQMGINDLRDLFTNDLEKTIARKGVRV